VQKIYPIRRLFLPLLTAGLFLWILTSHWPGPYNRILGIFSGLGLCFSLAWLVNNVLRMLIWDLFLDRYLGITLPQLIKDFVGILLYFCAVLIIIRYVFGESITALLAASGVMGLVIGMAVQNIISDVFSGITLNFDRNFHIGDRVNLHDINKFGKISEITWRSTRLITEGTGLLIIPNSTIAGMTFTNTSHHKIIHAELKITLDSNIPAEKALNILTAALRSTEGILTRPYATVRVSRFDLDGIIYKMDYWLDSTKSSNASIRHDVLMRVITHFQIAGFRLDEGKYKLNLVSILEHCSLFKDSLPAEKTMIAENMHRVLVKSGDSIFQEGEEGDSMFIVVEGLVGMYIQKPNQPSRLRVAYLSAGQFFGEMSLLSGEPRSVTVIAKTDCLLYEIKKPIILELLSKRPALAKQLSETLIKNKMANEKIGIVDVEQSQNQQTGAIEALYHRIKGFFKL
jgi:small-conductance mechanosensitive channel